MAARRSLGDLRTADEQVGQAWGRAGCSARAEPSTRLVCRPGRAGHGDRGRRVPLVLTAGVDVGVDGAAQDGRRLDAGRAHRHQLGAELLGQRRHERRAGGSGSPPSRMRSRSPAGRRAGSSVAKVTSARGSRDGAGGELAVLPERDVHGPVRARHLAVLPGAVERVDDPHPRSADSRAGSSCRLLAQHRVVVAGVRPANAIAARAPRHPPPGAGSSGPEPQLPGCPATAPPPHRPGSWRGGHHWVHGCSRSAPHA